MATGVDARLLKSTKFPPEFNQKVDMQKVNLQVIKKWIASKISEILGGEDDVVIELCFGLIEGSRFQTELPKSPVAVAKMQIGDNPKEVTQENGATGDEGEEVIRGVADVAIVLSTTADERTMTVEETVMSQIAIVALASEAALQVVVAEVRDHRLLKVHRPENVALQVKMAQDTEVNVLLVPVPGKDLVLRPDRPSLENVQGLLQDKASQSLLAMRKIVGHGLLLEAGRGRLLPRDAGVL
ncbi:conserved hypothetical protein [Verticillium alfalfae VaMs.102]|uniref:PWI domain-containing protein n=1 Tax=Verticillium alfalfae (strain VaMs.102 / ATCC MYA-4576 / FGSC 10136) TaxID=526221 RepID=C9SLR8_VERA1|nr:conserved hypothetical protein [Verticillium alfalfae VaMs.102]EEY19733.1 conserved hypothetical protein [Verticillium alfalfae VaMs.102]